MDNSKIMTQKKVPYPKPLELPVIVDMINFLTSPAPKGGMI